MDQVIERKTCSDLAMSIREDQLERLVTLPGTVLRGRAGAGAEAGAGAGAIINFNSKPKGIRACLLYE